MKLLITAEYSKAGMEELTPLFQTIDYQPWTNRGKGLTAEELCEKLSGGAYDALITELDEVSGDVLRKFPKLKFIGDCRGNPTNIDLQTAKELGIPVFCTPARNAQAVSEMLVGMMLSFYRKSILCSVSLSPSKKAACSYGSFLIPLCHALWIIFF